MANENYEQWGTNTKVLDETVKVARKFLNENKKFFLGEEKYNYSKEAKRIVKDSVEYLRPILETKSFAHAWDKK